MTHVPNHPAAARFAFDNTYARELEGFYVPWKAAQVARPSLVKLNRELAEELGLECRCSRFRWRREDLCRY